MQEKRRSTIKKLFGSLVAVTGLGLAAKANINSSEEKTAHNIVNQDDVPLFSGHTKFKGMVYIAGKGAHFEGDIKAHTDHVLKELEKELISAGSSMEKVLKVTVYLNDDQITIARIEQEVEVGLPDGINNGYEFNCALRFGTPKKIK